MTFICNRPCENKNSYGYCQTSYCLYPHITNVSYEAVSPPSRICSVCGKFEYEKAYVATGTFWLCDECLGKLKKLLNEEVKDEQKNI